jgi:uncharacterized membrane protein
LHVESAIQETESKSEMTKQTEESVRIEPRWPVALAILTVFVLLLALPRRIQLLPTWLLYILTTAVLVPIAGLALATAKAHWLRLERMATLLFALASGVGTAANLANLISAMIHQSGQISGLQLLSSSIAVWITNVFAFSLLYWHVDRGGPESRARNTHRRPDWRYPQDGAATTEVPSDWRPTYVDYLFLSFSTATAFSTTDVTPLTPRAKMLMMLESSLSLVTLVVVTARAINILGN